MFMNKKLALSLALLLILFGCTQPTGNSNQSTSALLATWSGVAAILLTISLLLMLLVYLFGNMLGNEKMKGWAKMELFEVIYSVIILAFALYAVQAANGVVQGLTAGNDPFTQCICSEGFVFAQGSAGYEGTVYEGVQECHIRLALYMLDTVFNEASDTNLAIYAWYTWSSMIADAQLTMENVFEMAGHFTFTPWRGLLAMGNTIRQEVFSKYVLIMMVAKFQQILVRFIGTVGFPIIFVMGTVLRSFTFTRKLGGLLMAIALTLFFIYPMFYAFGALIINQIKVHSVTAGEPNPPFAARMYVSSTVQMLNGESLDLDAEQRIAKDLTRLNVCGGLVSTNKNPKESLEATTAATPLPSINIHSETDTSSTAFEDRLNATSKKVEEGIGKISESNWWDQSVATVFESGQMVDIQARLAFFSVFFGILGILASIAAIKNLSVFLGGDTEIAGLTHLI